MKRLIKACFVFYFHCRFQWHSGRIMRKLVQGRWYIFRDEPNWLVAEWAMMRVGDEPGVAIGFVREGQKQAEAEVLARVNRLIAQANAAIQEPS